jgi:signal transduction histidine kinase
MDLSFSEVSSILINLIALSISTGWIFTLLIQPTRNLASIAFTGFCASITTWAFVSLVRLVVDIGISVDVETLLQLQISAMAFTAALFFFFVIVFLVPKGRIANVLTLSSPVVLLIALAIIWTGSVVTVDELNQLLLLDGAYPLFVISIGYLGITFWVIISSDQKISNALIIPSILLILGYSANIFDAFLRTPADILLVTLAVLWAGWTLLRAQVFNPLEQLNSELRTTNRGLQQVINDLASEKSKTEDLNQELIAANRYKSEFLANISHELRTPLNSIIGYSELLQTGVYGKMNDKQQDRVEKIYRNGMTLLSLISDILDLNKIDAGKMKLAVDFFDTTLVLKQSRDKFSTQIAQKGLEFKTSIEEDMPKLYGDSDRISQVIDNLLENAIKFTHEGHVGLTAQNLHIKNGRSDGDFQLPALGWLRDGEWVVISIQDTGIGIPPEEQGRIFDEFSQVDGSHTREYGGTGLGLAICKRLVEMHSGTIWVNSKLEQGSTFHVAFPTDIKTATVQ